MKMYAIMDLNTGLYYRHVYDGRKEWGAKPTSISSDLIKLDNVVKMLRRNGRRRLRLVEFTVTAV